jgi:hypothetical protein
VRRGAELLLAAQDAGRHVVDGVGDERAGDAGLDRALVAVLDDGPGDVDGGGGVGQVIGDRLVVVQAALAGEVAGGGGDDRLGLLDR